MDPEDTTRETGVEATDNPPADQQSGGSTPGYLPADDDAQTPTRVPLDDPGSLADLEGAVVRAVADLSSSDPLDLPPVGDVADLESLARFFGSLPGDAREDARVSFRVRDVQVTVADGYVTATRASEE
jgi:hypothetical protein